MAETALEAWFESLLTTHNIPLPQGLPQVVPVTPAIEPDTPISPNHVLQSAIVKSEIPNPKSEIDIHSLSSAIDIHSLSSATLALWRLTAVRKTLAVLDGAAALDGAAVLDAVSTPPAGPTAPADAADADATRRIATDIRLVCAGLTLESADNAPDPSADPEYEQYKLECRRLLGLDPSGREDHLAHQRTGQLRRENRLGAEPDPFASRPGNDEDQDEAEWDEELDGPSCDGDGFPIGDTMAIHDGFDMSDPSSSPLHSTVSSPAASPRAPRRPTVPVCPTLNLNALSRAAESTISQISTLPTPAPFPPQLDPSPLAPSPTDAPSPQSEIPSISNPGSDNFACSLGASDTKSFSPP